MEEKKYTLIASTQAGNAYTDHVQSEGKRTLCGKALNDFWGVVHTPRTFLDLKENPRMCKACLAAIRKSERPKFVQVPYKKKAFRVPVAFNKEATDEIKTLLKEYRRRCRTGL